MSAGGGLFNPLWETAGELMRANARAAGMTDARSEESVEVEAATLNQFRVVGDLNAHIETFHALAHHLLFQTFTFVLGSSR